MSKKVEVKIIDPNGIGPNYLTGERYSVNEKFAQALVKTKRAVVVLAPLKPIAKKLDKKVEPKK